jgi:pantetheine-phosphate adenylyltransferase
MSARHALYPGTFDPVTLGHLDILDRALALFDRVTVVVAAGGDGCLFPLADRVALLREVVKTRSRCEVRSFDGLLVDELRRSGADVVVRGIRTERDYEHEWSMFGVNRRLLPSWESVYLMARPELAVVSSTLVRDVARHGGDLSSLVPGPVVRAIAARLAGRRP